MTKPQTLLLSIATLIVAATAIVPARQATMTPADIQRRRDLEAKLQDIAVVERRVMIPMRDGVRLATGYLPSEEPLDCARGRRRRQGADHFREDAVQHELLGRAQRRAGRHVAHH